MAQKIPHDALRGDTESSMPLQSTDSRKPQLNPTVCGCHCGRASNSFGGSGEGGGHSDGEFPFKYLDKILSNIPLADRSYLEGDEGAAYVPGTMPPSPVQRATIRVDSPFADFELGLNGFQYGQDKVTLGEPFRSFEAIVDMFERSESPGSVANHGHGSDRPSRSTSDDLARNSASGDLLGLGTWTKYFFNESPLSLVPQWQIPPRARFQHISQKGAPEEDIESNPSEDLNDRPI
jgi:hypothetical protein